MINTIKKLIEEGSLLLANIEGLKFNSKLQSDYVPWRLQVLIEELEQDKNGPYFFENSASRVLEVLSAALRIVEKKILKIKQLKKTTLEI